MKHKYHNFLDFMVDVAKESKEPEKIAIMGGIYSGFDGLSRIMEKQAIILSKNNKSPNKEIDIFALEGNLKPPKDTKLEIMGAPKNLWLNRLYRLLFPLNLPLIYKYYGLLREYDILIAHQYPLSSLAWLTKVFNGNKYVYWHYHTSEGYPNFFHRIYMGLIEYLDEKSFLVKKADYVCSISEYSNNILEAKSGIHGIVVENIEDSKLSEKQNNPLNEKKIRDEYFLGNDRVILFVGRIHPTKNIQTLIEVFKMIKEEIDGVKLVIVGKVIFEQYYQEIRVLSDEVVFTGFVDDELLPDFYALCDVYATCSLSEGLNLPILEAQNSGKTVVAFDIPAHQEVIRNGHLIREGDLKSFADTVINVIKANE